MYCLHQAAKLEVKEDFLKANIHNTLLSQMKIARHNTSNNENLYKLVLEVIIIARHIRGNNEFETIN